MRNFVVIFSLIALVSGCTSIVNEVTMEPFKPDATGRTLGADIDDTKMRTFIGVNLKRQTRNWIKPTLMSQSSTV